MIRILTFTDVHLADSGPSSRKDDYLETMLNKLEQVKFWGIEKKCDLALCAGDIFHIKTPTKNSHYLVSQAISLFKSFPFPIYAIPGNHDLRQDNNSTLLRQPFYTLLKSGAIDLLTDKTFDGVRIFGMDYCSFPKEEDFNRERLGEKVQICVAHVNASSKFNDLFGEKVYTYQNLALTSPDIFVFGHYHPDQGIEVLNNKHFINVGSLSRGSLKKDELTRIPSIGYIEISDDYKITCEKICLTVLSPSEIFDIKKRVQEEKEQEEMEKFINEMKDKVSVNTDDNIGNKIRSLNFEKSIIDKALFYYEGVSNGQG